MDNLKLKKIELYCNREYEYRLDFNVLSDITVCSYEMHLTKKELIPVEYITIVLYNQEKEENIQNNVQNIRMGKAFNFEGFWKLNLIQQKTRILKTLTEILLSLNKKFKWGISEKEFTEAYSETVKNEFQWRGYVSKYKTSPSEKMKARLFFELDYNKLVFYLHLFNTKKEILKKIKILDTWALSSSIKKMNSKMVWVNDEVFLIVPDNRIDCKILIDISGRVSVLGKLPVWCDLESLKINKW